MPITKSRKVSRKGPMKGIKAIGFAPYLASDPVVNTENGVISLPVGMTTPPAIARIEVRATANVFTDTGTFDEATRTNEHAVTTTFFVPGNDQDLYNQVTGMAGILKTLFIEDYNGQIYVQGAQNGCDIMTLVGGSDLQGFTFTVNSKEIDPAYKLSPAGITAYRNALLPEA